MSGRKNVTHPVLILDAGDMSGDLVSLEVNVKHLDDCAFDLIFTGTPTGDFSIEATIDGETWTALDFGTPIQATGSAGNHLINLNLVPFFKLRVAYDATSGSGELNVYFMAKEI